MVQNASGGVYHLISGEPGTGKSTAIQRACWRANGGVLYVSVPDNVESFGDKLAKAIHFYFDEEITPFASLLSLLGASK